MSKAISWQTDSPYSHAALLTYEDSLIESWAGQGVRARFINDFSGIDRFYVDVTKEQAYEIRRFALDQFGKGYDWWGCLRFISRRNLPDNDKWFCSELVFAAYLAGGVRLLERIEPEQVSPGMLAHSPLLVQI